MKRPKKPGNVAGAVRTAVESGDYRDTVHSGVRQTERSITRPEFEYVLKHGKCDAKTDRYDPLYGNWVYTFEGNTVDGRPLRVVVSFAGTELVIITAMEVKSKRAKP
jgi:hypothetical protein